MTAAGKLRECNLERRRNDFIDTIKTSTITEGNQCFRQEAFYMEDAMIDGTETGKTGHNGKNGIFTQS